MFNKFLARIGIGAAQIDTLLEKARYAPGDEVRGTVRIKGGSVQQQIETISIAVMTEYLRESNDNKFYQRAEVARYRISAPFTLQAGESRELPFSFVLPDNTPLTIGRTPVWVRTELEVSGGVDPNDNDRIEVVPTAVMNTVFQAIEILGFRLRKVDCEYAPRVGGRLPFVQEFEYAPSGRYRGRLDELELVFVSQDPNKLELLLQIDRRARGLSSLFAEAMNMDESFVRVRLTSGQLASGPNAVAEALAGIIQQYI